MTDAIPLIAEPSGTALILVDLQNITMAMSVAPHTARLVLDNGVRLARRCREKGVHVVLIRVGGDPGMRLPAPLDAPFPAFKVPERWDQFPDGLEPQPGDIVVTKHNWGAFFATDLDQQLRRRGIHTLLIGGIATNFGVESTARQAHEAAYEPVLIEDAMTAFSVEEHRFAIERIFPRLGRVRSTAEVLAALA